MRWNGSASSPRLQTKASRNNASCCFTGRCSGNDSGEDPRGSRLQARDEIVEYRVLRVHPAFSPRKWSGSVVALQHPVAGAVAHRPACIRVADLGQRLASTMLQQIDPERLRLEMSSDAEGQPDTFCIDLLRIPIDPAASAGAKVPGPVEPPKRERSIAADGHTNVVLVPWQKFLHVEVPVLQFAIVEIGKRRRTPQVP